MPLHGGRRTVRISGGQAVQAFPRGGAPDLRGSGRKQFPHHCRLMTEGSWSLRRSTRKKKRNDLLRWEALEEAVRARSHRNRRFRPVSLSLCCNMQSSRYPLDRKLPGTPPRLEISPSLRRARCSGPRRPLRHSQPTVRQIRSAAQVRPRGTMPRRFPTRRCPSGLATRAETSSRLQRIGAHVARSRCSVRRGCKMTTWARAL